MSNPSRVTSSSTNEINIETFNGNCLSNFAQRIRNFCNCFGSKNEDNAIPLVHAVDSVRLVYMRRIEEASLQNLRRRGDEQVDGEAPARLVRTRRMKQEHSNIEALEKALKEYESKNKIIISSTRVPDSISFDKTCKISRSSQTDKQELLLGLLLPLDDVKMKGSLYNDSEEIIQVVLNNSNDKWTNTDNNADKTYTKEEIEKELISIDI